MNKHEDDESRRLRRTVYLVIGLAMPVLPLQVHQGLGLSTFVVGSSGPGESHVEIERFAHADA